MTKTPDDDKPNWWGFKPSDFPPLRMVLKHKPIRITDADGLTVGYEIHPEDAHLLVHDDEPESDRSPDEPQDT